DDHQPGAIHLVAACLGTLPMFFSLPYKVANPHGGFRPLVWGAPVNPCCCTGAPLGFVILVGTLIAIDARRARGQNSPTLTAATWICGLGLLGLCVAVFLLAFWGR
ncbi:MAG: hypothetical protein PVI86_16510, partial [Phycisphaerae bacterium]